GLTVLVVGEPLERGRHPQSAARDAHAGHHDLGFEFGLQVEFLVAKLRESGLARVDGLHPMKEVCVSACDLESDLGAAAAVFRELSRLGEVSECPILPG